MPARALAKLRDVIADDSYACAFQSFGQYRTALLKHIQNIAAGETLAILTKAMESTMTSTINMPLAASAYPTEHPFPAAVRRVAQLERALLSGVIVQLDELTKYTASPYGGMQPDPLGPWVTKLEVMGRARSAHPDGEALALFTSKMHDVLTQARKAGRSGWDDLQLQLDLSLAKDLVRNVANGDFADVAIYAMMLDHRNAPPRLLSSALDMYRKCDRDTAETFAQALIAQGWHSDSPNCVDGIQDLLTALLDTQAETAP